jgi:Cof subfamily protein (haloacid dehalogenase superfamily)
VTTRAIPEKVSLVFCDVDGTLVTDDKRLTAATSEAVRRLRTAGIRFAIGSSRPPRGLQDLAVALDLDTPMAAFNGGMIVTRDGAVLARHLVPRDVGKTAIELIGNAGVHVWIFTADRWLVNGTGGGSYVAHEQHTIGFAPTPVEDFAPYLDQVGKIVGVSEDAEFLARCEIEAARRLHQAATIIRSQTYYLDVTNPQANKAEALRLLAERTGIPRGEIVAIGDGWNDIGMLREAAFAVAMGNAPEAVRSAADFVTASNQEDGFAKAVALILETRTQARGAHP